MEDGPPNFIFDTLRAMTSFLAMLFVKLLDCGCQAIYSGCLYLPPGQAE